MTPLEQASELFNQNSTDFKKYVSSEIGWILGKLEKPTPRNSKGKNGNTFHDEVIKVGLEANSFAVYLYASKIVASQKNRLIKSNGSTWGLYDVTMNYRHRNRKLMELAAETHIRDTSEQELSQQLCSPLKGLDYAYFRDRCCVELARKYKVAGNGQRAKSTLLLESNIITIFDAMTNPSLGYRVEPHMNFGSEIEFLRHNFDRCYKPGKLTSDELQI